MKDSVVLFDELIAGNDKRIGRITLNAEKKLNTLTLEMVQEIHDQLRRWIEDTAIACILVSGSGDRAFCAGGDVHALHRSATQQPGGPCAYAEAFFEQEYRMDYLFHTCPKPVIAWGHGVVMGGGIGILSGCSHRVVAENTRMAMPEVTIALFPDVGGGWFFNRMPGRTGLFLAVTGAIFNATDALYTGLADYFIPHANLGAVVNALQAQRWADAVDDNHGIVDALLAGFTEGHNGLKPPGHIEPNRERIEALCLGTDAFAILGAIAELDTDDAWLAAARDTLAKGSPLSALWIFRHIQRTRGMRLEEVFQADLQLATRVVRHPEFAEGVRALLIDKDRNPRWQYSAMEDVPSRVLDGFFTSPWPENPLADL